MVLLYCQWLQAVQVRVRHWPHCQLGLPLPSRAAGVATGSSARHGRQSPVTLHFIVSIARVFWEPGNLEIT
jgi:hypothetical protein